MATFTTTSRIKSRADVTAEFDLSKFNDCVNCCQKPRVERIFWGKRNSEVRTVCKDSEGCSVFGELPHKWNKFNPALKFKWP